MRPSRQVSILVVLAWATVAVADQTCLLDDAGLVGRWQPDVWSRASGSVAPATDSPPGIAGARAIEVRVDWPMDDEFRFFSIQPQSSRGPIPYRVKEVSLWVRGGGDRHFLEVHFKDAKGGDAKIGFGASDFQGWRRLSQPVPAEVPQPLIFTSLTWHSWGLKGAGGTVVTALARLEAVLDETQRLVPGEDAPELLVAAQGPGGLADATGKAAVDLSVLSWSTQPRRLSLAQELLADDGKSLKREVTDLDFAGEYSGATAWQLPACGCFRLVTSLSEAGSAKVLAHAETRLARVVAPSTPALSADELMRSPIGVNTHLGAPWEVFGRLGIHWARDYSWTWLGRGETAPVGNGRDFAAAWGEARRQNVMVLPVLQGAFRNKAETGFLEDSAAISAGFERLSKAFPDIPFWEIDNEYEYALRDGDRAGRGGFDMADYERALQAAATGLARAGKARVVPNGTAGVRCDQAEALLASEARDAIPCINSHIYVGTAPPETGVSDTLLGGGGGQARLTMTDQLREVSRLAHAAGKESWLTETGWDVTNGPAVGEARQAEYLARVYLLARACGVDKVFWFYDRDVPGASGVFSTCGLLRLDGSLRPSAVAMAALSRETARATFAGTLDFGADFWAVVLAQPDGTWTVAAWSVEKDHPLPEGLAGIAAVDILGNPAKPQRITPSILYFRLAKLPEAWDLQRQATWDSPTVVTTSPGGSAEVRLSAPGAKVRWGTLPAGVSAAGWREDGRAQVDTLRVDVTARPGVYALAATAEGEGWRRSFAPSLLIEPALAVSGTMTYEPEQPEIKTITSAHLLGTVTARLVGDAGTVAPAQISVAPGLPRRIAVVPGPSAAGTLTLELSMDNGIRQTVTLFPLRKAVPRLAATGDPRAWPPATLCPCEAVTAKGTPADAALRLGWSEAGLIVAGEMPDAFLTEGKLDAFWDFTNLEVFVDPSAGGDGWTSSCRQFWLTPVRDGQGWRVAGGPWDRVTGKGAVPDPRCQATVTQRDGRATFTVVLPPEVVGRAPAAGETWRLAVSAHGVSATDTLDLGWPRRKTEGLLAGPSNWGLVTYDAVR